MRLRTLLGVSVPLVFAVSAGLGYWSKPPEAGGASLRQPETSWLLPDVTTSSRFAGNAFDAVKGNALWGNWGVPHEERSEQKVSVSLRGIVEEGDRRFLLVETPSGLERFSAGSVLPDSRVVLELFADRAAFEQDGEVSVVEFYPMHSGAPAHKTNE